MQSFEINKSLTGKATESREIVKFSMRFFSVVSVTSFFHVLGLSCLNLSISHSSTESRPNMYPLTGKHSQSIHAWHPTLVPDPVPDLENLVHMPPAVLGPQHPSFHQLAGWEP
jgi:hypothetical protein